MNNTKSRNQIEAELIIEYANLSEAMRKLMFIQLVQRSTTDTLEAINQTMGGK